MKVFLTDAHYRHTLGAARALASDGAEAHVGSRRRYAFCTGAISSAERVLSNIHKIRSVAALKPARFSWVVPTLLAASERPRTTLQLNWVKRQNLKAIVDLTESPVKLYEHYDGTYRKIPMKDHAGPSLPLLQDAVGFIREQNSHGQAVLVHCLRGLGRTGTVLACYLIEEQKMRPEEAIDAVRTTRPGSIEKVQEGSVSDYFKAYWRIMD